MGLLRSAGVGHQLGLDQRDVEQLLTDRDDLVAVVELLHEVPGLEPRHPGDVYAVHRQDFVAHLERPVLVRSTA